MTKIQAEITRAFCNVPQCLSNNQISGIHAPNPTKEMLLQEKNFMLLFSTIVWFIEQDMYTNVAMTLDVNFWQVKQINFFTNTSEGKDMNKAIMQSTEISGMFQNSFQNSQIHLVFYEKISELEWETNQIVPGVRATPPDISSMSTCKLKLKSDEVPKFPPGAYDMALDLILSEFTGQFVTAEQYAQLMLILGQHPQNGT